MVRADGGTRSGDIPLRQAQGLEPVETAVAVPDSRSAKLPAWVDVGTAAVPGNGAPPAQIDDGDSRFDRLKALSLSKGNVAAPCSRHSEDYSQEALEGADVHDVGDGEAFVVGAHIYRRG